MLKAKSSHWQWQKILKVLRNRQILLARAIARARANSLTISACVWGSQFASNVILERIKGAEAR